MNAETRVDAEDLARAQCYAIIGRLMYGAPDAVFVSYIVQQPATADAVPLAMAWKALQIATRDADIEQTRLEYDDLFVGVGKAPVTPYTSGYASPQAPDRHLLGLRNTLDALGLSRRTEAGETEDHVSALCDTMRWLIETGQGVEAERRFFYDYVAPAIEPLCTAIVGNQQSAFYKTVAAYMLAFYEIERAGFELVDTDG